MLIRRLFSAAILISIVALVVRLGGFFFFAAVLVVAVLAGYEFYMMMKKGGYKPSYAIVIGLILVLLFDARYPALHLIKPALAAIFILSLSWQLFKKTTAPSADWALSIAGGLYIGWLMGHFISLRDGPRGMEWTVLCFLSTWAADAGAYLIGLRFGKRRLWPRLSPGKTWEGTIGGGLCGIATTLLIGSGMGLSPSKSLLLGASIAAVIPFGDLSVSMMKRHVGVKDTSSLIPGHGGMLDRIDSLLFSVVVVYYYALWAV
jgi:phosphatidate cytidylyltransferase